MPIRQWPIMKYLYTLLNFQLSNQKDLPSDMIAQMYTNVWYMGPETKKGSYRLHSVECMVSLLYMLTLVKDKLRVRF